MLKDEEFMQSPSMYFAVRKEKRGESHALFSGAKSPRAYMFTNINSDKEKVLLSVDDDVDKKYNLELYYKLMALFINRETFLIEMRFLSKIIDARMKTKEMISGQVDSYTVEKRDGFMYHNFKIKCGDIETNIKIKLDD